MSAAGEGRAQRSEAAKGHNIAFCATLGEIARAGAEQAQAAEKARCWIAVPEGEGGVRLCESTVEEAQWLAEQLTPEEAGEGAEWWGAAGEATKAIERASEAWAIAAAARAGVRIIEATFDGSGDEDTFDHMWAAGKGGSNIALERVEHIPVLEWIYEHKETQRRITKKSFEEAFCEIATSIASREGSDGWEDGMGGRQTMQWEIDEDGGWTVSEALAYWELKEATTRQLRSEPGPSRTGV